jgi:LmbE family N-acetylglucosaminyl deacetylase
MNPLFVAPHPDDESLFGAYIVMQHKCDVAVMIDEKTMPETIAECVQACYVLGAQSVIFVTKVSQINPAYRRVFAPALEGGHKKHDQVFHDCCSHFPEIALKFYATYGKDKSVPPAGRIKMDPTPAMQSKKLEALACYKTQIELSNVHFALEDKSEWLF